MIVISKLRLWYFFCGASYLHVVRSSSSTDRYTKVGIFPITMHRRVKFFCLLCVVCVFVYFYDFPPCFNQIFVPIDYSDHIDPIFHRNDSYSFKNRLVDLNRRLQRAHRYAKSGVVISVLNEAHAIANSMLKDFFDYESSVGHMPLLPNVAENLHYANCSAKPLDQYLTILINAISDTKIKHLSRVLEGILINYANLSVTIAVPKNLSQVATHKLADSIKKKSFVDLLVIEPADNQKYWDSAQIWKLLIENAKTKYVFVARGLIHFDDRISLERLTRMVSLCTYFELSQLRKDMIL
uniref:Uncharacterized protein n=1 Tax=Romanomermis culicivorax TaxID=13658 RepID=A0A915J0F3_ROMCU